MRSPSNLLIVAHLLSYPCSLLFNLPNVTTMDLVCDRRENVCFVSNLPTPHQKSTSHLQQLPMELFQEALLHFTLRTAISDCGLIRLPTRARLLLSDRAPSVERHQELAHKLQGWADCYGMQSEGDLDVTLCQVTMSKTEVWP